MLSCGFGARYGRGQETGGEDAWLNEQVATEYVLGLQDGPATGDTMLLATAACKHILIYDSQQPNTRDVNASLHDLHDYYLRPWRACATVAHSASMMCSYGSFNGLPDCLHKDYIAETIRDKWNWTGFVVSDWYARPDTFSVAWSSRSITHINACVHVRCAATPLTTIARTYSSEYRRQTMA